MGTVMQRQTHKPIAAERFFVNGRGVLMERRANRPSRHTGFSMAFNGATRSEMQILADLLNEPGRGAALDAGEFPLQEWVLRTEQRYAAQRRTLPLMQEACCAA